MLLLAKGQWPIYGNPIKIGYVFRDMKMFEELYFKKSKI